MYWLKIAVFFLLVSYSLKFGRFFVGAVFPICVLMAIYFLIGVNFGVLNAGQVVSVFNTDWLEAKEFLSNIPVWQFLVPVAGIGMLMVSWWTVRRLNLSCFTSPAFVIVMGLVLVYFAGDLRFFIQGALRQRSDGRNERSCRGSECSDGVEGDGSSIEI